MPSSSVSKRGRKLWTGVKRHPVMTASIIGAVAAATAAGVYLYLYPDTWKGLLKKAEQEAKDAGNDFVQSAVVMLVSPTQPPPHSMPAVPLGATMFDLGEVTWHPRVNVMGVLKVHPSPEPITYTPGNLAVVADGIVLYIRQLPNVEKALVNVAQPAVTGLLTDAAEALYFTPSSGASAVSCDDVAMSSDYTLSPTNLTVGGTEYSSNETFLQTVQTVGHGILGGVESHLTVTDGAGGCAIGLTGIVGSLVLGASGPAGFVASDSQVPLTRSTGP